MQDGSCTKGYPKSFSDITVITEGVYPKYRRRDLGYVAHKNGHDMDSRDVVPYNPGLCMKYNAHINVEVVTSIKSVKYLYKYSYKGHDRATLELGVDEIKDHVDARYVGPPEAVWRLLEFPMSGRSHHIERLALHLEDQQAVTFEPGEESTALQDPKRSKTTLTAWFDVNSKNHSAREHLYHAIPTSYTWNQSGRIWKPRRRMAWSHKVIGRIHGANPAEGERYYLHLLLLHVPGATSFHNLRTVNGICHETFRAAAEAVGLIDSDDEYELTLESAAATQMPIQFRRFFAHLLLTCEIKDPLHLWTRFAEDLSEDFAFKHNNADLAKDLALQDLQRIFENANQRLSNLGLPEPEGYTEAMYQTKEIRRETTAYNSSVELRLALSFREKMYDDQAALYDSITASIDSGKGGVFFADGPGGSGKTFVEAALLHYVRGKGNVALACAWSGVAATLLEGGRTCHSTFGFPVPMPRENVPSSISAQSGRADVLRQAAFIVWDEAPMSPSEAVIAADTLLQDFCGVDDPFGGKTILFAGVANLLRRWVPKGMGGPPAGWGHL